MALPECFGIFWEGIPSEPNCHELCGAKQECLAKFATETLVKHQQELGDKATVHALAEVTGVKAEAILLAIDYQQRMVKSEAAPEVSPETQPAPPAPAVPPAPAPVAPPAQGEVPMPPPVANQDLPAPPLVVAPDSVPEPPAVEKPEVVPEAPEVPEASPAEPEPEPEEETVAAPKKKAASKKKAATKKKAAPTKTEAKPKAKSKSTKKAASGATPKKKVPPHTRKSKAKSKETPGNFPKAGSASPAVDPAKAAKASPANPVEAPDESRAWSPEHNLTRWKRERAKNPLVRKLPEGYVIEKEYPYKSGKKHRVVVCKQSYRYQGREYPTLGSVQKAIAGVRPTKKQLREDGSRPQGQKYTVTCSVNRFFSLAKLMLTLEEERAGKGRSQRKKPPKPPAGKKSPPKKRAPKKKPKRRNQNSRRVKS